MPSNGNNKKTQQGGEGKVGAGVEREGGEDETDYDGEKNRRIEMMSVGSMSTDFVCFGVVSGHTRGVGGQ